MALSLTGIATSAIARDAIFELSSLDGRNGFVINGDEAANGSLRMVNSAGDVNGDGFNDVLISVREATFNGNVSGASYVVFGASGAGANGTLELSTLDGNNGFVILGVTVGDFSGWSISAAGDVNNDGIGDLLIGAPSADPNGSLSGASYLVFGARSIGSGGVLELSALDGSNGFVINGATVGDTAGVSVSAAGDVNDDGIDDFLIGAPTNGSGQGTSYVVFGDISIGTNGVLELSTLDGNNGFSINGVTVGGRLGVSVSAAGDVNNDGIDDLLLGAPSVDINDTDVGASYVVFGTSGVGAGGVLELSSLDGDNGFVLNGFIGHDQSGMIVNETGDINGDGIDDLLVGARRSSFAIFGANGIGTGGVLELSSLDGSNGFMLSGILSSSTAAVSGAGDVNDDGLADLLIGSRLTDTNGNQDSGASYVVFGTSDVGASGTLDVTTLDGDNGYAINGVRTEDFSGSAVSTAGDINGDGIDDLLISAPGADINDFAGASYVVFGQNPNNPVPVILETQIITSSDDAEEKSSGSVNSRSSDLDLGEKLVGLRFAAVNIPAGAIITRAYVQFDADESNSSVAMFELVGEANDSSLPISPASQNISSRAKTTASTTWAPDPWIAGDAGIPQQTSDISAIVQEIVKRPGWSGGNALTIIVSGSSGKRVAVSHNKNPAGAPSLHVEYTLANGSVADIRVANNLDDAEENEDGSIQRNSSDLELGFNKTKQQTVGMRFNSVNIPQGSTITAAYIQFQADETDSVTTNLLIEGEATDHAQAYASFIGNISSRNRTQAAIAWTPPPWTSIGEAGPNQQTPDIASIIQEVIDRPGWLSGNALGVVVTGNGQRTAESYDGMPSAAPLLHMEYISP
ncbi:MAG: integrin alpha [Gammaproteobacteria bacterium]|nr:integrin alpha [Gammaproteobacteria bacterium]